MRVSEIRVKQIRVNQGLGVCTVECEKCPTVIHNFVVAVDYLSLITCLTWKIKDGNSLITCFTKLNSVSH